MFENIDIEKVKEELKNHSKNYRENFTKIEKFIETEIQEILNLKKNNKSIIPEISINELDQKNTKVIEDISLVVSWTKKWTLKNNIEFNIMDP